MPVKQNPRGAGRKQSLTTEQIDILTQRHEAGERIGALAQECGVSRQTLSKYLNHPIQQKCYQKECHKDSHKESQKKYERPFICMDAKEWKQMNADFQETDVTKCSMRMEFMYQDEVCTVILVNFADRWIRVQNRTSDIIHRAFGIKARPSWEDFEYFLEDRCFPRTRDHLDLVLDDLGLDFYDPMAIIEVTEGCMAEDDQWIRILHYAQSVGATSVSAGGAERR